MFYTGYSSSVTRGENTSRWEWIAKVWAAVVDFFTSFMKKEEAPLPSSPHPSRERLSIEKRQSLPPSRKLAPIRSFLDEESPPGRTLEDAFHQLIQKIDRCKVDADSFPQFVTLLGTSLGEKSKRGLGISFEGATFQELLDDYYRMN